MLEQSSGWMMSTRRQSRSCSLRPTAAARRRSSGWWRDTDDLGEPVAGPVWLEPWPDEADPAASYLRRESVELAFVAALQHLPATQRVPPSAQQAELDALGTDGRRELVDAFVAAWERADVAALLELLAEDARSTMPPLPAWFLGHEDIGRFFTRRMFATPWRLLPVRANGQLAFACYQGDPDGDRFRLGAISVLSLRGWRIVESAGFLDPGVHRRFGLPEELPDGRGEVSGGSR